VGLLYLYTFCTFNAICKDNDEVNFITFQDKRVLFLSVFTDPTTLIIIILIIIIIIIKNKKDKTYLLIVVAIPSDKNVLQ
jgi:hypothetical protein